MAVTPETREIQGRKVNVTPWPGRLNANRYADFTEIIGKIGKALDGTPLSFDADITFDAGLIGSIFANFAGAFKEKKFGDWALEMLSLTTVDDDQAVGDGEIFDVVFQGKMGFLFEVLAFAVEVNFRDFFELLKKKWAPLLQIIQSSPATSSESSPPSPNGSDES